MTAVKRDGSPPHFHSPLRIGEVMAAPLALEPQNETPHAHPYLPCSPHACDIICDAQPTHTLPPGWALWAFLTTIFPQVHTYAAGGGHRALEKVESPART